MISGLEPGTVLLVFFYIQSALAIPDRAVADSLLYRMP